MTWIFEPWVWQVIVVLQVLSVIHVIVSRQEYYWIFILLFFPLIGCLIYVILNFRGILGMVPLTAIVKAPMVQVLNRKKVERDYRYNPSVDNKILYSDVLLADGRHQEALDLFQDDIEGPLKNNIDLLFTYAKILYTLERYEDALSYLERAESVPNSDRIRQRTLLAALCLEQLDRHQEADARYQACQAGFMGEEARYRYGAFLEKTGDSIGAKRCYQKTLDEAQYLDRRERRRERMWIHQAKAGIERLA